MTVSKLPTAVIRGWRADLPRHRVSAPGLCSVQGAGELAKKLGYFGPNAHRMRYQHVREPGMFIGSGAVEGACKAIVVQRARQSGMHWITSGAAGIIALRGQHASGRWDELWPAGTASRAAPFLSRHVGRPGPGERLTWDSPVR